MATKRKILPATEIPADEELENQVEDTIEEEFIEEEEVDDDEEGIFLDGSGPSQQMVDLWKSRYGQVYSTEVDEEEYFIWRVLTRGELKGLAELADNDGLYKEEVICEKCVLWPAGMDFSTGKAGIPSVLSEQIFEKSGFGVRTGPVPL